MIAAREHLLRIVEPTYGFARERLGLEFDVAFVIYVGIGVGAGWATRFEETPACLFGLENIAELGWLDEGTLSALTAHELGHLTHEEWRTQAGLAGGDGLLWTLYSEGLAMRMEHRVMGRETWHEQTGQVGWLAFCQNTKARLARLFLSRLSKDGNVADFFGSWYKVEGFSQTGYYLGHEVIKELEDHYTLRDIALFSAKQVEFECVRLLAAMV